MIITMYVYIDRIRGRCTGVERNEYVKGSGGGWSRLTGVIWVPLDPPLLCLAFECTGCMDMHCLLCLALPLPSPRSRSSSLQSEWVSVEDRLQRRRQRTIGIRCGGRRLPFTGSAAGSDPHSTSSPWSPPPVCLALGAAAALVIIAFLCSRLAQMQTNPSEGSEWHTATSSLLAARSE
jgi:hypothetical protein